MNAYPDPLGFGKSPSRFSDTRRRIAENRFGVLYLGETLKVCFLEALLRLAPKPDQGMFRPVTEGLMPPAVVPLFPSATTDFLSGRYRERPALRESGD